MISEIRRLHDRITEYLIAGGLWNPEQMEHDKVRLLLFDIRDELEKLAAPAVPAPQEGFTESLPKTQQEIIDRFSWAAERMSREQIAAALALVSHLAAVPAQEEEKNSN